MASKLSIRKAQVHVPNTCAWCDSVQDINWYCNDCQEALCDKCKEETHQRARRTRNDDVVPIKQANKTGQTVLPEVCKVHPGKTCDLFCTECNVAICSMCFTTKHKQHAFKHFEDEINTQKHNMREQLETLKFKLDQLNEKLSNRRQKSKTFKESVDIICKDVKERGRKLKAEIDSIVDNVLAELSSLVAEEDKLLKEDCEHDDKCVKQIKQLNEEVEQLSENPSSGTLFELTRRLRTTIPLYDVTGTSIHLYLPSFETGQIDTEQLTKMIGFVKAGSRNDSTPMYEKKEINNQHVRKLTTFQTPPNKPIFSICPIDDTYAWISMFECLDLLRVNKKGNVTETVKLDFTPWSLALTNSGLLMTRTDQSPLIHKLSEDRRVTTFAEISPLKASSISVSDTDEVFVSTGTTTILVLNIIGDKVRQISCGHVGKRIASLTGGNVAVTTGGGYCKELNIIDRSGQIVHTWSGELDNGQKLSMTIQNSIACDKYDRVFVPDLVTHQVYVISRNERKAKCILDEKHGVRNPLAVGVDRCGHVWIGCGNGTVYVMQL
ncbi:uncharacterized protein LOC117332370 [Pecten maximus]|uniref:uncharacterized protein LOC117332370 n=1 Tax=Pecten maximus TaxID=6579 RepID=UPI00145893DD|nr:uncharacterized protein LOC117332370 [Pecten maximus]